ncbi:MAG: DUF5320 domain-containing protein [Promethearchaeota archaeon]
MPFGDGTGPNGLGPMTGRGLGYCAGYSTPGYMKGPGRGWGLGFGRGWGRGWGRGFGRGYWRWRAWGVPPVYPATVPAVPVRSTILPQAYTGDQLTMLKQEKEYLESELNGIRSAIEDISKRIEELEKEE